LGGISLNYLIRNRGKRRGKVKDSGSAPEKETRVREESGKTIRERGFP